MSKKQIAGFVVISLLILFGCAREKRAGDTLYLRLLADLTTLDPALIVDVAGGSVGCKLFNGLVRYDREMNIIPDLATRWEISPDNRSYTFYLREGVRFANGGSLTAWDVKYSFQRVLAKETRSPRTWVLDRIIGAKGFMNGEAEEVEGIKVPDDYTLCLTLREPFAPFLGFLAMPAGYIVSKEEVKRWGEEFGRHAIGTGPFRLSEWRHGERIVLTRNEDYFDALPKVKKICYRIIPEDLTAIAEFESGNIDLISIPSAEFERFLNNPEYNPYILSEAGLNVYYLGLNCEKEPFNRMAVRQAINYAIDKQSILDTILKDRGILSCGPIPPSLPGHNQGLEPYPYDPVRAKELLLKAGFKDGFEMTIYQKESKEAQNLTEVFQAQLKQVGIRVKIVQREWSAFKEAINKGEPDSFYLAWIADYPDAENFLAPLFHSKNLGPGGNRARFKDEEIDRLIQEAEGTVDDKKRIRLYNEIEGIIRERAPWVFLWHLREYVVHQPWVKNLRLYPIYNADKGTEIELAF